eukprot:6206097-Amphidinium_carterae.2
MGNNGNLHIRTKFVSKVNLYAAGLGSEFGQHDLYTEPGNAGNTVLDSARAFAPQKLGVVTTVTLDQALMSMSPLPYIHLAKAG